MTNLSVIITQLKKKERKEVKIGSLALKYSNSVSQKKTRVGRDIIKNKKMMKDRDLSQDYINT